MGTLVPVGEDDSAKATADEEVLVPVLEVEPVTLVPLEETEVVDVVITVAELKVVLSIASPHCCNLFHPSANSPSHHSPIETSQ